MIQFILEAADATSTSTSPYGNLLFFGPLILIAVGMYFFLIRPQRKKDKELSQQISEMQVGDKIVIPKLMRTVVDSDKFLFSTKESQVLAIIE